MMEVASAVAALLCGTTRLFVQLDILVVSCAECVYVVRTPLI